jgi:hypothetical protein
MSSNEDYKRLTRHLYKTRKYLHEACKELSIDFDRIDPTILEKQISTCTHCSIWSTKLIPDLDENPICITCAKLIGL